MPSDRPKTGSLLHPYGLRRSEWRKAIEFGRHRPFQAHAAPGSGKEQASNQALCAKRASDELATQLETSEFDAFSPVAALSAARKARPCDPLTRWRIAVERPVVAFAPETRTAPPLQPHGDALGAHMLLHLTDGKLAGSRRRFQASTASASPSMTPWAKCSSFAHPARGDDRGSPPHARRREWSAQLKPSRLPSRSMLVSRISPAPRRAASCAQATASMPVALRPPAT